MFCQKIKAKLQTTPLKFESVWILHIEILEFRFYSLKFGSVWILHYEILEFRFYSIKFGVVCILLLKVWMCLENLRV